MIEDDDRWHAQDLMIDEQVQEYIAHPEKLTAFYAAIFTDFIRSRHPGYIQACQAPNLAGLDLADKEVYRIYEEAKPVLEYLSDLARGLKPLEQPDEESIRETFGILNNHQVFRPDYMYWQEYRAITQVSLNRAAYTHSCGDVPLAEFYRSLTISASFLAKHQLLSEPQQPSS